MALIVTPIAREYTNAQALAAAEAGMLPIALTNIDIDGGTDIGEAIVDADLLIIDNGAGGTNRKAAASRLTTYIAENMQATAAAVLAGTNQDTYIAPDLAINLRGLTKTWGHIFGAGGISTGAQNVASVTDSGTGDRTLNYSVDFANTQYVYGSLPIDAPANPPPFVSYANVAVGSIDLNCTDASGAEDFGHIFWAWGNF